MVLQEKLYGKWVALRSVEEADADFVLKLRLDGMRNRFLHETKNDASFQREWICRQRKRAMDYYCVVCAANGRPVGLSSVYEYDKSQNSAIFGRWISLGNAIENLETVRLFYDFSFENLKIQTLRTPIVRENAKIIGFWKRLGSTFVAEYEQDGFVMCEYAIHKQAYASEIRPRIMKLLDRI